MQSDILSVYRFGDIAHPFQNTGGPQEERGRLKQDMVDWIAFEKKQLSSIASEQSISIYFLTDSENTGPDVLKHFMQNGIIVKEAAHDEGEVRALVTWS